MYLNLTVNEAILSIYATSDFPGGNTTDNQPVDCCSFALRIFPAFLIKSNQRNLPNIFNI